MLRADILALLGEPPAWACAHQAERHGDIIVPAVNVRAKMHAAGIVKSRLVQQPHGDPGLELDRFLLPARNRIFEVAIDTVLRREQRSELQCILDADTAVAAVAFGKREQRLGGGVVEINLLRVLYVELYGTERILVARRLHEAAVFRGEAVVLQPLRTFGRELLRGDGAGDPPFGIRNDAGELRLKLGRLLVGFAGHDVAAIYMPSIPPVIELRGGHVDVDARGWRVA